MSLIQGNTKVSAAGGYTIAQSVRFNDDDSAYLYRTFGTPTDATNWTFSSWIKRCNLGTEQWLFNSGASAAAYYIRFESTDKIRFRASTSWDITTTQVFRDVSAFYHIVATFANGAVTLYVNNESIATASVSDTTYNFFTNIIHSIGGSTTGSSNSDLYLAETHGIDGQALAPTNFGEYNDDGVWIPKAYAGTYGNNGFYITGENSAALGNDYSGNSNNFTSSGLTSDDQVSDSPTLNFPVISPIDRQSGSNAVLSDGNLKFTNNNTATSVDARATFALPKGQGKWYFEMEADILGQSGINREYIGIVSTEWRIDSGTGGQAFWMDPNGFSFSTAGSKGNNNSLTSYGSAWSAGDIIGCAVDLDNNKIWWSINNTWQNSGDPAAGTNAAFTSLSSDVTYAPAFAVDYGTGTSQIIANFGQTGGLTYTPPTGFSQIDSSTLPTPAIADGSAHFQATTYTGAGYPTEVNQSGNSTFQPDFVWIKRRSGAAARHCLFDAVRGGSSILESSDTRAENTVSGALTFDSDGFTAAVDPSFGDTASSGNTFVGWQWLAANGTASNEDGDITSTVSANVDAGFSIVSWTLGSTDNQTVGHGLSAAPEFMFLKNRDAAGGWTTYHKDNTSAPETEYLRLDSTNATTDSALPWNDTAPTSSVFTIGDASWFGSASDEMMMWCFRSIPGFSMVGSFTGNGSATNGPFVQCSFRPAWVLIKATTTKDWPIQDTTRDPYNVADKHLFANLSVAEYSDSNRYADYLSNGFKIRTSHNAVNTSGQKYLFLAFAEHPFGGAGVAPATAR